METTACALCGSSESQPLYQIADYWSDRLDIQASLVTCARCGLIYQNPRPTRAEMGQHYGPEYEVFAKKGGGLFPNRGQVQRCAMVTAQKQPGSLLDIGCATGTFLLEMQKQPGWTLTGLEPDAGAAEAARANGLQVIHSSLDELELPDASFDAVTMWDVLEHLHDPSAALGKIHRLLKPGGVLVARLPNGASHDARLFGPYWAGLDAPRHLYVFTPQTLAALLGQNGFELVATNTHLGNYLNFVKSVRFALTAKRWSQTRRKWVNRLLANPVSRLLAAPLFALRDANQGGSALTFAARKIEPR
jgi:2-polyprenyl-3-methyl-5-hydroxy-6-metoxy-1,4-benzoquinol methylase